MGCVVKVGNRRLLVNDVSELSNIDLAGVWRAKCVGNDEDTVKVRTALLDAVGTDGIVFYKDSSFGPYPEGDE